MTLQEFSVEFDILYDNISSNQAPGLTEYEKSVFLTQAQEALILDLYKGNMGDSFETTEEVTRYLSFLVKSELLYPTKTEEGIYDIDLSTEEPLWFLVYQSARLKNNKDVLVVVTTHDTLFKNLQNPFKGPNQNRVLSVSEENKIRIYSKYPVKELYIKYLKRPSKIDLESENQEVDLPESLHLQVLLRAVQMAKAVWQS